MAPASSEGLDDPRDIVDRIGPFKIIGVLGRGSMGIVFDAEGPDGQRVALKTIRPFGDDDDDTQIAARFEREATILAQLDHPAIVRLIDSGRDGDILYLAMERVEGISLLSVRRQGPLGFRPLMQLGVQLAEALSHLHEAGVIHRDIKPANVMVRSCGQPVITDFGISGLTEATNITRQGDLLGSPGFMAPEVIDGHPTSRASDQYSLGRLLFELGARGDAPRLPRDRPLLEVLVFAVQVDWQRLPTEAPWPELRSILTRMMERDPADRYPDVHVVAEALRRLQNDGGEGLDVDTLSEHIQRLEPPPDMDVPTAVPSTNPRVVRPAGGARGDDTRLDLPRSEPTVELPDGADPPDDGTDPPEQLPPGAVAPIDPEGAPPLVPALRLPTEVRRNDPVEGIPLDELVARREGRAHDAGPRTSPRASSLTAAARASIDAPDSSEVDRLTRANRDLQRALADAKTTSSGAAAMRFGLVAAGALLVGLAIGAWAGGASPAGAPPIVLVAPPPSLELPASARFQAPEPPEDRERGDAIEMWRAAHDELRQRDVDGAIRLLRLCIRLAEIPTCHRDLGTVLAVVGDPAARAHFERYLTVAPDAADAPAIRAALNRP